tara:strand:- start:354 stop:1322 length:969 start_codon:yes stop_codon:yes gene_type:complete
MHTKQTIFLDFEEPIKEIIDQIEAAKELSEKGGVDAQNVVNDLEAKLEEKCREIHDNLTPWQKVQLSRHPERPYTLDYIMEITGGDFMELHGDRNVGDDKAMIGGFGSIDGQTVMFIGQQKGRKTKQRQMRNFGMANPEGYRKALRLMKLAEKFNKPVVCLIDTPGAYPGLEAEERGQGEAIARNLYEMMILKVPVICVIIGEGASGGALGIGIGDKVLMLENTWYSVISPESCSSILWRSWDFKEQAADALKLTARNMHKNKLIDGFIKEPLGGAHANPESMYKKLKTELKKNLTKLGKMKADKRIQERIEKFSSMGVVEK